MAIAVQDGRWTWARGPRLAVALFLCVTASGTLGYMAIEGWTFWDALYMTIISVTTVGYREVHEMSWAGEAWTMLVLVSGVSTLFYTATLIMSLVVEGGLHRKLDSRRFNRMLDELTQHFIICGYGRIGSVIADEFRRQDVPYVVIDRDPERVHDVIMKGGLAVEADASREEVLARVGIERARGSSPPWARMPRTSTRCSRPEGCNPGCSSWRASKARMPKRRCAGPEPTA